MWLITAAVHRQARTHSVHPVSGTVVVSCGPGARLGRSFGPRGGHLGRARDCRPRSALCRASAHGLPPPARSGCAACPLGVAMGLHTPEGDSDAAIPGPLVVARMISMTRSAEAEGSSERPGVHWPCIAQSIAQAPPAGRARLLKRWWSLIWKVTQPQHGPSPCSNL